ncbi:uncharacterized protein MELLADRAFT_124502 [Melampsora larici-populina 98AG31]|uniref:Secreted protein n=1 Tax=Melampsora larici-populina (strain 98AG31 / pathotype 3-4-7) TaxID=747676 RepID=F4S3I6_MELLP|nr:uncharacterized protein MELLADRAFT_124502 [Melampsora larici-populina 98AG31]EGG00818.1 secreted protein [Melampsora larici-populina 98AG31]
MKLSILATIFMAFVSFNQALGSMTHSLKSEEAIASDLVNHAHESGGPPGIPDIWICTACADRGGPYKCPEHKK